MCFVGGLGTGCQLAAKTFDDSMTNHVTCGATVDGVRVLDGVHGACQSMVTGSKYGD